MVKINAVILALLGLISAEPSNETYTFPHRLSEGNEPDWQTFGLFDDKLREKIVVNEFVPSKGIPLNVFATGPFEPPTFKEQADRMPEGTVFDFHSYTKTDESVERISKELEKLGIDGAYQAFRDLRARAFKADLWRWMILWEQGGIYMDAKFFFTEYPDWIDFENEDLIICGDHGTNFGRFANGFIVMTKHHPVALPIISEIIRKVNAREYPDDYLALTGPSMVVDTMKQANMYPKPQRCSVAFREYMYQGEKSGIQEIWAPKERFDRVQNCYLEGESDDCIQTQSLLTQGVQDLSQDHFELEKKVVRASTKDERHGDIWWKMKQCKLLCNDYGDLSRSHQVYCDEPGEPCNINEFPEELEDLHANIIEHTLAVLKGDDMLTLWQHGQKLIQAISEEFNLLLADERILQFALMRQIHHLMNFLVSKIQSVTI